MIYIHELKALNPKTAQIESVPIIRGIREKARLPVSEEYLLHEFIPFFVRENDIAMIEASVSRIGSTLRGIAEFHDMSSNSEPINLTRAMTDLQNIRDHLAASMEFARKLYGWQAQSIAHMTRLINKTGMMKTREEKARFNSEASPLFETVLRNDKFCLRFMDMINEAHVESIKAIMQGMQEGIFFHFEHDECLKKKSFSQIRARLPADELMLHDKISAEMPEIKKGVDAAYDINMRMIGFAVHLYSYIAWQGGF